jgi:hypothetical protein
MRAPLPFYPCQYRDCTAPSDLYWFMWTSETEGTALRLCAQHGKTAENDPQATCLVPDCGRAAPRTVFVTRRMTVSLCKSHATAAGL